MRPPVAATVQAQTVGKEAGSFVRMTPHVSEVCPADFSTILPHHGFVDAFATTVETAHIDMLQQAHVIMGTAPRWVTGLMSLRNFVVKPLGLKTEPSANNHAQGHVGMFPVIFASAERVILGLDDKHLDFRLVLDRMQPSGHLRLSTAVRCRNIFGRLYLAAVMPFHKRIVPAMLRRAA